MNTEIITLGHADDAWVPQACTLPTAEQPLRVAEFDRLFASSLRDVERTAPTRLRMRLDRRAESKARELTDREAGCCSFFTFSLTATDDDEVLLQTVVPAAHTDVLDALAVRASAVAGLSR